MSGWGGLVVRRVAPWIARGVVIGYLVGALAGAQRCVAQEANDPGADDASLSASISIAATVTNDGEKPTDTAAPGPATDQAGAAAGSALPEKLEPGFGAPPTPSMIEAWLTSGDPRRIAWGAYHVVETHDDAAVPTLLGLASCWVTAGTDVLSERQRDERAAMANVLDALVQLNATPPAETLRAIAPDFQNAAAIFLTRMPAEKSTELRMEFFRLPSGQTAWRTASLQYVSSALLALRPMPGFAAELMRDIEVQARVYVLRPDSPGFGEGEAGDCASSSGTVRQGWPSIAQYELWLENDGKSMEIVGGIDPIYAKRTVGPELGWGFCGRWLGLTDERRRRFIAEMAGVKPENLGWDVDTRKTITFTSQEQYEKDLVAFVNGQIEKERATATTLADKSLITPGDVNDVLPRIDLVVDDERGPGMAKLSEVANLPEYVSHVEYRAPTQ